MLGLALFVKNNKWPLLLILLLIFSHGLIYRLGYNISSIASKDAIIANQVKVTEQITQLSGLSTSLSLVAKSNTKASELKIDKILSTLNSKPMTVVVEGKCKPSNDFKNSYISIIKEGNAK